MVDRYLLRYFLAVVDCGTFSRGAAQANVAQPTLSVGIAKLERLLGQKLFERTSQRVHLTEAGTRLAIHARRIESEFNLAETVMRGVVPMRAVRLGILSTLPASEIATFAARAAATSPDVQLELVEGTERSLLQHLARGRIEMALTLIHGDADRFAYELLRTEHYALAMAPFHPLAGESSIAAEALANEVMIVRRHCEILSETSRHFTERGIRPFFACRTTSDDRALALVRAGVGITMMPECYRFAGIAQPHLSGFQLKRRIGLLWAEHADHLRHSDSAIVALLRSRFATLPAQIAEPGEPVPAG